jgi:carbon-monoxide dehydrogenase medium subunit
MRCGRSASRSTGCQSRRTASWKPCWPRKQSNRHEARAVRADLPDDPRRRRRDIGAPRRRRADHRRRPVARPDAQFAAGAPGHAGGDRPSAIGAGVTHAAIADGRTPDIGGILANIAQGIAYRAVRNAGTIGGSLCHADPAADWLCTLTALGASVLTWSGQGGRSIPLAQFVTGAFRTVLAPGEIVQAVRVPRPSPDARWGYYKACRKPGEFAHAMAAVLDDPRRGIRRAVIGAAGGPPVVLEGVRAVPAAAEEALRDAGLDAVARRMQAVALRRALDGAVP